MGRLYSSLKMFHFPDRLESLAASGTTTAPIQVRLKPTNICNHRCRYCAYRQPDLQLGQDMRPADSLPEGKFMEIARDLADMGVRAVTFSGGGEPLLHPSLLKAARVLCDGGVSLACLTNGSLLRGETAEFWAEKGTWLRVSIDGWDEESYSCYRGTPAGEFNKVIKNMADFAALGGSCRLGVSFIVDEHNWAKTPDMLRLFKDTGVGSVKVSACVISDEPKANNAYHAPHFKAAENLIIETAARLADKNFEVQNAWHLMADNFAKNYHWCPFSRLLTVIGADAAVYPCQDKAYNGQTRLGDLKGQSFKDFWASSGSEHLINPAIDCGHHCVSNAKNKLLLEYLELDRRHIDFV